jgi:hypothetical protein
MATTGALLRRLGSIGGSKQTRSFHRQTSTVAQKPQSVSEAGGAYQYQGPSKIIESEVKDDFNLEYLLNDGYVE